MAVIYQPKGKAREYAPYAANLYRGCSHGCLYCYAPAAIREKRARFHASPQPRREILQALSEDCKKGAVSGPVLLSFTTDAYQPIEDGLGITREAIKMLKITGNKVEILTKGGPRACRDFDLLGKGDAFATTLTFLNEEDSRQWEPGAALPNDRMSAMQTAYAAGISTWASMEPVIDPEQTLALIEMTAPFVDLFKVGKLNHHPLAKEIDWQSFGRRAVSLLESLDKAYYVKKDLQSLL